MSTLSTFSLPAMEKKNNIQKEQKSSNRFWAEDEDKCRAITFLINRPINPQRNNSAHIREGVNTQKSVPWFDEPSLPLKSRAEIERDPPFGM